MTKVKSKFPLHPLPQRVSLVAQTAQCLREGIVGGEWHKRLPGERILCARLQVSRTTLRAALDELQRAGWLETFGRQCRRIRTRRVHTGPVRKEIGVISASTHFAMTPLMMFVLDVLREKLAKTGYTTQLHVSTACFSARPARALKELVLQSPAAAWLIFGSKEPMQHWFIERRIPCLVVGSCAPHIALPSVDSNHRAACLHAGGVLLRKGHARVAIVLPQNAYGGDLLSEAGLAEALKPTRGRAAMRTIRHDGSVEHLCTLLDHALRSPQPPTAFLVAGGLPTLTVMMHLQRLGRRIPQDVAVIACEDDPALRCSAPAVAHYAVDPEKFARRLALAARQLAESGALPSHHLRLMPNFYPGESV